MKSSAAGSSGPSGPSSSFQFSQPPDLTPGEKEALARLWNVQTRDVSDVNPTSQSKVKPSIKEGRTIEMINRLQVFASAILTKPRYPHLQTNRFVKPRGQSCLESYCRVFLDDSLDGTENINNNSDGSTTSNVRLRGGKRIFTIHYEEFMNEFNEYECQNEQPSEVFVRQESYGAFLYHYPIVALPAINVALAFAVLKLWRKQQKQTHQSQCQGSSNNHDEKSDDDTRTSAENSKNDTERINRFLDTCHLIVRFVHVTNKVAMADIKTGLVKKFISVKGHVVKAKPKRLRVATADFSCPKCATVITHAFDQGKYSMPTSCSNPNCKGRTFNLSRPTARYINTQELRLQEAQDESTSHAGRTPRQLEVELVDDDLMDACRPGDIVLLACWVDAINSAVAAGRAGKRAQETSTYKLFLQGHSITTLSESVTASSSPNNSTDSGSQYTQQQLQNITQLCHADHRCLGLVERRAFPFDLLVRSLCPSIIGHHAVKAGILLCLLGGTPPDNAASNNNSSKDSQIRSNSHILIVGDPGMGKSQMLNAATQLAARSVYVGGNTSSTTGLTVTLTKEEGGETGIEAGALVLADQGVACIDELDKCKHLDGLLEAMEQQQVSIAKAGVVASLPARCSVIAAANPKHGSYNMSKTVAENLNMARPILSRFDLVFILRDRADKDQDRLVSSNIMNLYRSKQGQGGGAGGLANMNAANALLGHHHSQGDATINENRQNNSSDALFENRVPLEKRLAWVSSFNEPLPAGLVRDYIAYAREFCKPKLTQEAATILQEYYMNLRYPNDGSGGPGSRRRHDTVPITTRQLEALIRLSQARAKSCLREFVLKEDAMDVVELLKRSVEQVHTDEYGIIDRARGGAAGQSNRKRRKEFTNEIYRIIGVGAECSLDDLRRVADRVECSLGEFSTMIDDMRNNGVLMKKPDGRYQVLS